MSRFNNISFFLFIMTLMVSCTSSRTSLTYFEDLKGEQSGTLSSADYDIKVIPDDELFIVVSSLVPEATAEFNLPTVNPAVRGNVGTPSQQSQITYLVDKAGDINFPGLGTLHVGGLTTAQIASIIAKKVSETVEDPYVKVQLVNFKVNVLGEVARPAQSRSTPNATRCLTLSQPQATSPPTANARTYCSYVRKTARSTSITSTSTMPPPCRRPTSTYSRTTSSTWSPTKYATTTPSTTRTTPTSYP